MQSSPDPLPAQSSPLEAARNAIWRLFQEGYMDEDMATAGLLAVDLGMRRTQQRISSASPPDSTNGADRH